MVASGSHTYLYCCVKSSRNRWITGSHESIYELLGTYMKESERYSLAPITELGEGKKKQKKRLDSMSFPRKTSSASSGKVQVTGSPCGKLRPLSEGNYVSRYSAVNSHPQNMWFL